MQGRHMNKDDLLQKEFGEDLPQPIKDMGQSKTKHLTDTTNAEKIAEMFGDKLRFDHRRHRWLIWKSNIWSPDKDGTVSRYAIAAARERYKETSKIDDLAERATASKWAIQSESKMRLDAAISILKNLVPIADHGDMWDTNPMLLSCKNGVIDLTAGELRAGLPEDRITMTTGIQYDPNATCPRWEQFIDEVFESNDELKHYIHKALGYSITGGTKEQVAFFCHGMGSNGKSVMFKVVRELLGEYSYNAPASLFRRSLTNTSTNDVAATENKRFLVSAETLSSSKLNEQRLKAWTGGDRETARFLYGEFFEFDPSVKIWLFLNHKPSVEDDSFGFWRRVRMIPFNRTFTGKEADTNLFDKLKEEYPGILNWLVKGCLLWQAEGLNPTPGVVLEATKDYRIENDVLAEFVYERCIEQSDGTIKASELYRAYVAWAETKSMNAKEVLTSTAFGRRMGDKYQRIRMKDGMYYNGISLQLNQGNDPSGVEFADNSSHEVYSLDENSKTPFISSHKGGLGKTTLNPTPSLENHTQPYTSNTNPENYDLPIDL